MCLSFGTGKAMCECVKKIILPVTSILGNGNCLSLIPNQNYDNDSQFMLLVGP
jgi:hypothetical protein